MGGAADDEVWVCLPGARGIQSSEIIERNPGVQCDRSIECVREHICVCIPGAICSGQGKQGPTCEQACDPDAGLQCARGLQCTALGPGRGFCDPSTFDPT